MARVLREIRPACTFVQVSGFVDPTWLVEIEAVTLSQSHAHGVV
jgi:hypothetical protein